METAWGAGSAGTTGWPSGLQMNFNLYEITEK
jgi:hypothetical protein